ncbi:hypothetical protein DPMN_180551 [Dreissena polymorpha]|uniref:Uncharacterized protein n=1 Tax=Dreissena polymorpha TaxID=45954 RepID=A0A9D4EJC7_DREPO|nr:hypothetical protein DPMN_180551 [Dreissena polymorpha]
MYIVQYSPRGTNIILGHATASIVITQRPRGAFRWRIAEELDIDRRSEAESL